MNQQTPSIRVLARKKREALALKANIQRRKEQARQQTPEVQAESSEPPSDE